MEATIRVRFTEHAIDRMLAWGVEPDEVLEVLGSGDVVEEYDDGTAWCSDGVASSPCT